MLAILRDGLKVLNLLNGQLPKFEETEWKTNSSKLIKSDIWIHLNQVLAWKTALQSLGVGFGLASGALLDALHSLQSLTFLGVRFAVESPLGIVRKYRGHGLDPGTICCAFVLSWAMDPLFAVHSPLWSLMSAFGGFWARPRISSHARQVFRGKATGLPHFLLSSYL